MAQPDFDVLAPHARTNKDGTKGEEKLQRIGAAWNTRNGGIGIQLDSHPIGDRLLLLPFKAKGDRGGSDMP